MLIQSVLLASLTSLSGGSPVLASAALGASSLSPLRTAYLMALRAPWLQLALPCAESSTRRSAPCLFGHGPISISLPGLIRRQAHAAVHLPSVGSAMGGTLGGFKSIDVMDSPHLSAGPQLSWLTPDSPREDLLRLRVVAPGWGVRYTWQSAHLSVGVAAGSRFVMFGEDWPVVDMLTSEARVELRLP